jgi:SAM-dependent methyltransferase
MRASITAAGAPTTVGGAADATTTTTTTTATGTATTAAAVVAGATAAPAPDDGGQAFGDEAAGAREPYEDASLYDWEYRRRKEDVAFYRMLADEQGGPVLDLGCGSGRLLAPLLQDGHGVVGLDLSAAMLARAARRVARLGRARAGRAVLLRADLRALPLGPGGLDPDRGGLVDPRGAGGRFPFAVSAFHTIQHLVEDRDLLAFFRQVGALLTPTGWFAFDVFVPHPDWLARPAGQPFDHTIFRHPRTGVRTEYSVSHTLDRDRRCLHMRFEYRALERERSARTGPEGPARSQGPRDGGVRVRTVRLCHRQLGPGDIDALTAAVGLRVIARWASFEGLPLDLADPHATEQHVYLVGPKPPPGGR